MGRSVLVALDLLGLLFRFCDINGELGGRRLHSFFFSRLEGETLEGAESKSPPSPESDLEEETAPDSGDESDLEEETSLLLSYILRRDTSYNIRY